MQVDAHTITDDQITELCEWAHANGLCYIVDECFKALGEWAVQSDETSARTRCAKLIAMRSTGAVANNCGVVVHFAAMPEQRA